MPHRKKNTTRATAPEGWFSGWPSAWQEGLPILLTQEEKGRMEEQVQSYRQHAGWHPANAALFVIDCQAMTCLYVSDSVQQVLGLDPAALTGRGLDWAQNMMPAEEAEYKGQLIRDIREVLVTLDPESIQHSLVQFNLEMTTPQGRKLTLIEEWRFPLLSASGKPLLATVVIHELSPFVHTGHRSCRMLIQQASVQRLVFEKIYMLPGIGELPLSKRELELLACLANGMSTTQVADRLFVSDNTVKTHRKNILRKLEVNTTAEAVRIALQNKWI